MAGTEDLGSERAASGKQQPFILTIDQSTSATKAILFDTNAVPLYRVRIPHAQHRPQPGWVEQEPEEIYANTVRAIVRVISEPGIDPRRVQALGIANQRQTIVVWDGKNGEPLSRALVWQDERGADVCARLRSEGLEPLVKGRTGLLLDPAFSAAKLNWIIRNSDAAQHALAGGRLYAGTIDTWLVWRLTGGRSFVTDLSNACRTSLLDFNTLRWDEELIDAFGLHGIHLPHVLPSDGEFGTARIDELSIELPICAVMGDSHAALFGHAGFSAGAAKTTYGTGSSTMLNVGRSPVASSGGIVSSVGWGFRGEVTYVQEGAINYTGDTVRWVRDNLQLFGEFAEAEKIAESIPDNGGVYLVPAFTGLAAPHWKHGVQGLIAGLGRDTGRAEIVRAALESVAFQIHDVVDALARHTDLAIDELRVDGGASANGFLMQFQSDILDMPLRVSALDDISARGVAFVAGSACGVFQDPDILSTFAVPERSYYPRMAADRRRSLLDGWRSALDKLTVKGR
ncbi:FGGY family carbohydrate kinase [Salinispira pacifica]